MNGADLLALLVSIPSVSGSERALAAKLEALLTAEGFQPRSEEGNVWFSFGQEQAPHLLLVSHLDTVPACAGWTSDPVVPLVRDGALFGLGANDAKGCVAAMIMAAKTLASEQLSGRVTFAFVVEEETGGSGIRFLKPKIGPIDAAIVGEPTSLEICTEQRGMLILRCIAAGRSAHAAHAHLGENAVHKAARDIARLSELDFRRSKSEQAVRPQVTQVQGGLARNQVPDRCEFYVDIRTTVEHGDLIAGIAAALESDVTVHSDRYQPVSTAPDEPIVRAALAAANRTVGIGSDTTSDWAFLKGIPAVKAGPGDTRRSHQPNEHIRLDELDAGAAFYAGAVRNYFALAAAEVAHA